MPNNIGAFDLWVIMGQVPRSQIVGGENTVKGNLHIEKVSDQSLNRDSGFLGRVCDNEDRFVLFL